jgi:hypothetical protein
VRRFALLAVTIVMVMVVATVWVMAGIAVVINGL